MMEFSRRKPLRLQNHDYSKCDVYFVTLCVQDRENLFWAVGANCVRPKDESIPLSRIGMIVDQEIQKIPTIYENVKIEKYCIMPDRLHLIIAITSGKEVTAQSGGTQCSPTLSRIVKQFKGSITKQIGDSIWQKSFYDHIIRDEKDYKDIWDYIDMNLLRMDEPAGRLDLLGFGHPSSTQPTG